MPDTFTLIIFGFTGNLTSIKLLPALYDLEAAGQLSAATKIIGIGRSPKSDQEARQYLLDALHKPNRHHDHPIDLDVATRLADKLLYFAGDLNNPEFFIQLKQALATQAPPNHIYYLATYPHLYSQIFDSLHSQSLTAPTTGWVRVVIEKPIGTSFTTASELNRTMAKYFVEDQIYRLDHYLGRETLQNLLTFRFGNGIFEPLINRDYIDHVQVTASEDFGVGLRGGYYDTVGALRDVGQNHLLQMLALSFMDSPQDFTNASVSAQRIKLIQELVPPTSAVFGQYRGYNTEPSISVTSTTDTFFAFKTHIANPRFQDIPIYVRAGKKLARTVTEVAIVFKNPPKRLFTHIYGGQEPNILVYRIQPNEGIVLRLLTKTPGLDVKLEETYMQFCYRHLTTDIPDPYVRLISDVLRGDQTFFTDAPEVEAQWQFTDPIFTTKTTPATYEPGSWGPAESDTLLAADNRVWLEPSVAFCNL